MPAILLALSLLAPAAGTTPVAQNVCVARLADHVGKLASGQVHAYASEVAVVADGNAYASRSTCGEDCNADDADAQLFPKVAGKKATKLSGAASVAVPGYSPRTLGWLLYEKDGLARVQWKLRGKTFDGEVKACSGSLFVAADGRKSSIVIELAARAQPPA